MRNIILGLVGAAALAVGSSAGAAVTVNGSTTTTYDGPSTVNGVTTIGFTQAQLASPAFTENVSFTNTLAGIYNITLTTSSAAVDFTSAMLTGMDFSQALVPFGPTGPEAASEFYGLETPVSLGAGTYNLAISGVNRSVGSLGGSITINSVAAVPEPGTWALMLLGFGATGFAMRRSRRSQAATALRTA